MLVLVLLLALVFVFMKRDAKQSIVFANKLLLGPHRRHFNIELLLFLGPTLCATLRAPSLGACERGAVRAYEAARCA